MPAATARYRGRFAPSPTGPLHLGSLIAALASYLDARNAGGQWLLRMEDLDPPREEAGAAEAILASLERHSLHWDGDVMWQGQRAAAYDRALAQVENHGSLLECVCTRAELGPDGACDGRCAARPRDNDTPRALRVRVPRDTVIHFHDRLQGPQSLDLGAALPDFTLRRKDGLYAYQLAVVVDDAAQGITHVVRGSDLLDSTFRQAFLQRMLGLPQPDYCHIPVITTQAGQKFSKQNQAPPLDDARAGCNLRLALRFLGQASPPARLGPRELLAFATEHWSPGRVPVGMQRPAADIGLKD